MATDSARIFLFHGVNFDKFLKVFGKYWESIGESIGTSYILFHFQLAVVIYSAIPTCPYIFFGTGDIHFILYPLRPLT